MIKKIKVFSLIIALIVNMCIVPTYISYADTLSNPIRKIAIKTTALTAAVGAALGITAVNGWEAYKDKFLDPVSSHLRRYEEKDGVIGAYVKDGKTYVSKEIIQDVADYMTEHNMYTHITNDIDGIYLNTFLDVDGFMDNESFLTSCPYYSYIHSYFGESIDNLFDVKGFSYYFSFHRLGIQYYNMGVVKFKDNTKYIKIYKDDSKRTLSVQCFDENQRDLGYIGGYLYRIAINDNDESKYYSKFGGYGADSTFYYVGDGIYDSNVCFRIGLNKQIICELAYSVADSGLKGKTIDNWDSAWTQQVIDVLKDIQINTSISADDISSADESQVIDALPLSLPQYGIDGTTADVAMQNTASIPMSQAKSGEVTLSPSAIDALSEAIAKAISEAGTTTGEQTKTGEITIPQPVYKDLSSYKLDLTDVFPFCIPFDLVDLIKVFSATPEAPKFSIPIKYPTGFNSWGTYDLEVDLSPFDSVALVVRTLESVLFILGLLKITRSSMIRG